MSNDELLEQQNELLRTLVRLIIDERLDTTKEKAQFLSEFEFTHQEIAAMLSRDRSTISGYIGGDK